MDEICYPPGRVAILDHKTLVEFEFGDGAPNVAECRSRSGVLPLLPAEGAGAGMNRSDVQARHDEPPRSRGRPERGTTLYAVAVEAPEGSFGDARTLGTFFIEGQQVFNVGNALHDGIDPTVSFLSNSTAMVAWTRGGIPGEAIPVFDEIDRRNIIAAHQDVLLTVHRASTSWIPSGAGSTVLVSDRPDEVPAFQKRADGMATLSADLSAAAQQSGGEAMVAWARYDGPVPRRRRHADEDLRAGPPLRETLPRGEGRRHDTPEPRAHGDLRPPHGTLRPPEPGRPHLADRARDQHRAHDLGLSIRAPPRTASGCARRTTPIRASSRST